MLFSTALGVKLRSKKARAPSLVLISPASRLASLQAATSAVGGAGPLSAAAFSRALEATRSQDLRKVLKAAR